MESDIFSLVFFLLFLGVPFFCLRYIVYFDSFKRRKTVKEIKKMNESCYTIIHKKIEGGRYVASFFVIKPEIYELVKSTPETSSFYDIKIARLVFSKTVLTDFESKHYGEMIVTFKDVKSNMQKNLVTQISEAKKGEMSKETFNSFLEAIETKTAFDNILK